MAWEDVSLSNHLLEDEWFRRTEGSLLKCRLCGGPISDGAANVVQHFQLAHEAFLRRYQQERYVCVGPGDEYQMALSSVLKKALEI